jgi:hypothetical protein
MRMTIRGILLRSFFLVLLTSSGCAHLGSPIQTHVLDPIGYFEYRAPEERMHGVIIGVPHGGSVPGAASMARWISDETGAGFVAAYGFKSKRVSVEQPVVRSNPHQPIPEGVLKRRSVFREFKTILRKVTNDDIDLYVGLRSRRTEDTAEGIEVVASGFSFEEMRLLNRTYEEIRDRLIGSARVDKLRLSFASVDQVRVGSTAVKNHGALLIAERGLSLRIPENFLSGASLTLYRQIFSEWVRGLERLVHQDLPGPAQMQVNLMDLGRFDSIPARRGRRGIVIGAPHGTYDEYTAEIVTRLAFRTGLAAVIARGFTPTEAGGWRINVNRPTEKTFLAPEFEAYTSRSREVYDRFKKMVLDAAGSDLRLYFDVHQYGRDHTIQVATVGVDIEEARSIKQSYPTIRDHLLKENPGVAPVEFLIEPLDILEVGAWPAKQSGVLSVARKSFHIDLPLQSALASEKSRSLYTRVIAELIKQNLDDLSH